MSRANTVQELTVSQYKVYCEEDWAKNFPPGGGRPPFYTSIAFDNNFASIYERWEINQFEEGFRIRNVGTGFWASSRSGEVDGSSEFDPKTCKWYIETAGNGKFKVLVPGKDSVWTVKRRQPEYPKTLFLAPADGSPSQLFSFERLVN